MSRKLLVGLVLIGMAGCQTAPLRNIPEPPVTPELIASAPLQIASTCDVASAVDIDYAIEPDGTVTNLSLSDAPACAREALTTWVNSYRYAPQSEAVTTGFAWMRVMGKRGS